MAKYFFMLFFFVTCLSRGQTTYISPVTQHWPTMFTTEYEEVNRSITVEANSITIATENQEGKEIQILIIREIKSVDGKTFFSCTYGRNKMMTLIFPPQEEIKFIDVYRASPTTGEEIQLRFFLTRIIRHSVF